MSEARTDAVTSDPRPMPAPVAMLSGRGQRTAQIIAFKPRAAACAPAGLRLRRPRLLVRAARCGQAGWRRERDLMRLLGGDPVPPPGEAVAYLAEEEARLDEARRARAADYMLERHITVLIALLAELRLRPAGEDVAPACLTAP